MNYSQNNIIWLDRFSYELYIDLNLLVCLSDCHFHLSAPSELGSSPTSSSSSSPLSSLAPLSPPSNGTESADCCCKVRTSTWINTRLINTWRIGLAICFKICWFKKWVVCISRIDSIVIKINSAKKLTQAIKSNVAQIKLILTKIQLVFWPSRFLPQSSQFWRHTQHIFWIDNFEINGLP